MRRSVRELTAYSTFALTLALVLARPRVGAHTRINPAFAAAIGAALMFLFGVVTPSDAIDAAETLWQPLLTLAALMTITSVAEQAGVLDHMARAVCHAAKGSTRRLFALVFLLGYGTAAVLNNDSAILLLTPLVVTLVRRLHPDRPEIASTFAFAVLVSAGIAPFVVSNPMNMIVANYAGIDFNTYAQIMAPLSLAGSGVSFLVLLAISSRALRNERAFSVETIGIVGRWTHEQIAMLVTLAVVFLLYPVASIYEKPIWVVALAGAGVSLLVAAKSQAVRPGMVLRHGIAWEILAFLYAIYVLALGLQNAGIVDRVSALYAGAGLLFVGSLSAVGSAVLNNHSMAIVNMLAIAPEGASGTSRLLAAMIGGDLGPRLLPIGSLAGLLWLQSLRRMGVTITLRRYAAIGFATTIPTLLVTLAMLQQAS